MLTSKENDRKIKQLVAGARWQEQLRLILLVQSLLHQRRRRLMLRTQDGRRKIERISLKLGYSLQHLHLRHSLFCPSPLTVSRSPLTVYRLPLTAHHV